ncbi:MAG: RNA methyltransferase [Bacteroidota bacterium]
MNKKRKLWELNRPSPEVYAAQEKIPIVVLLDDIRSFENVGSVFRTADSFSIEQVVLCGITPTPPHREIHKTALGATESVSWRHSPTVMEVVLGLKELGYAVYALEQAENTSLLHRVNQLSLEKVALVFGNEVHGVQQAVVDVCDGVLEIPQFGTKHSLNVSVCVGITLWEFSKHLNPLLRDQP